MSALFIDPDVDDGVPGAIGSMDTAYRRYLAAQRVPGRPGRTHNTIPADQVGLLALIADHKRRPGGLRRQRFIASLERRLRRLSASV